MTRPTLPKAMLQVHIIDDLSGELLADVDASSTADGLAYYLRSRNIVPDATEETVNPSGGFVAKFGRTETIAWEERSPIVKELLRAVHAKGRQELTRPRTTDRGASGPPRREQTMAVPVPRSVTKRKELAHSLRVSLAAYRTLANSDEAQHGLRRSHLRTLVRIVELEGLDFDHLLDEARVGRAAVR